MQPKSYLVIGGGLVGAASALRLQAAVGMLDENAIRQVNGWLTATKQ